MKNIHILQTDKPSNLTIRTKTKELMHSYSLFSPKNGSKINVNQNIYITSDEEIKKGGWFIHSSYGTTRLLKCKSVNSKEITDNEGKVCWLEYSKKIILTTNQDLIKDGVQAIDDEFLEWFVKNPSCEEVETKHIIKEYVDDQDAYGYDVNYYKIIIPKEKPIVIKGGDEIVFPSSTTITFKAKQETLEEAAERIYPNYQQEVFIEGAKWQQERSYSESDMIEFSKFCQTDEFESRSVNVSLLQLFEQFKKR
tara:strand:+ start:13166 stop:13921 length:756 start_codon:yes stop_codon:yes gene_type:complete